MLKSGAKLRRGGLSRRTRLKPRSRQEIKDKELDTLCRRLIWHRDQGHCQRCRVSQRLQWCHIHTRAIKSMRWRPENSLLLCAGCHLWWHHHPTEAVAWFTEAFPANAVKLRIMRINGGKVDRPATKLWLKEQIARLGG